MPHKMAFYRGMIHGIESPPLAFYRSTEFLFNVLTILVSEGGICPINN